jgi:hypothetical protein
VRGPAEGASPPLIWDTRQSRFDRGPWSAALIPATHWSHIDSSHAPRIPIRASSASFDPHQCQARADRILATRQGWWGARQGHGMTVSATQFWVLRGRRAAGLRRFSVAVARFAVLVGLSWAILASLTIITSQAGIVSDGAMGAVSQTPTAPAEMSIPAAPASRVMTGNIDCSGAGSGSAHHSYCSGACCSSCPPAFSGAAVTSIDLSNVRINIIVLKERPAPFNSIPDLRPPILA